MIYWKICMDDDYAVVYIRGERMPVEVNRKELSKNLQNGRQYLKQQHLRPGQILDSGNISEDTWQTFRTVLAEASRRGIIHLPLSN
jgi:hypothetical protein